MLWSDTSNTRHMHCKHIGGLMFAAEKKLLTFSFIPFWLFWEKKDTSNTRNMHCKHIGGLMFAAEKNCSLFHSYLFGYFGKRRIFSNFQWQKKEVCLNTGAKIQEDLWIYLFAPHIYLPHKTGCRHMLELLICTNYGIYIREM